MIFMNETERLNAEEICGRLHGERNMKAIVIERPNALRLRELPVPVPAADEVLVKVAYCGVCGTDYDNFKGESTFAREGRIHYPLRFGHEWSGVVVEVGNAVRTFRPGDRVVGDGKVTCTACAACKAGHWYDCRNLRSVGTVDDCWPGAMAEYMRMPERNLYHLADHVSLREAALIEPAAIAYNGFRGLDVPGTNVLILGTGAIGLAAVQCARSLGAARILVAGRKSSKLALAEKMGADRVVSMQHEALEQAVLEETAGVGADIVLDTTGSTELVRNSVRYTANMGSISLLAFYDRLLDGFNLDDFVLAKKSLRGISGSREYFPVVARLLAEGKLHLLPLITHEISFDQALHCMEEYEADAETRVKLMVRF